MCVLPIISGSSLFIFVLETVLAFGIYTVLETVPSNEIHLDELSGQSYEEIKETLFYSNNKKTVIL
jgi:hypothetical protein